MVLVEQGKVSLDDPVEKYLSEFKGVRVEGSQSAARPMSIRHLLSHTAGFWGNQGLTLEQRGLIRNFRRPLAETVERNAQCDLVYEPGTKWIYSGTYRISEADLHNFLNNRFADDGATLNSLRDRTPANPKKIGNLVGPLGWVVTENTVVYSYVASNGGVHDYYHDSNTGLTYQDSAYW